MHVLTVLSHPDPVSFSHAIAVRFMAGAKAAGHTTELADLHAEGFDPRWSLPDLAQFDNKPMPDDVLTEQARIERCDALAMVFPLFWWGMPAMLKGWIDRVWSWGWAYDQIDDPDKSLLRNRIGVMLVPAGASPQSMAPHGYPKAKDTIWRTGTMGYLGLTDRRIHILHGSTGSARGVAEDCISGRAGALIPTAQYPDPTSAGNTAQAFRPVVTTGQRPTSPRRALCWRCKKPVRHRCFWVQPRSQEAQRPPGRSLPSFRSGKTARGLTVLAGERGVIGKG